MEATIASQIGGGRRRPAHVASLLTSACLLAACVPVHGITYSAEQKITASDAAAYDWFGHAGAVSGDTVVIGAYGNDDGGTNSGSAYVFDAPTGGEPHKLSALDAAAYDVFGYSVAVSGNIAVIGAYGDDDNGSNSGSAYVFDVTTGNQLRKLAALDAAATDSFGHSVAVSGTMAVVGARWDDDKGNNSGSAYVFDVTTGNQLRKLIALDGAADDLFGYSVAVSGNMAVVGAYQNDDNGSNSGSAYVFDITTGNQMAKLTASDAAALDLFGYSVAVSGNTAIIGAYQDDDGGSNSGSAYVFDVTTGSQLRKLTASDAAAFDQFGYSVAVSGNMAVIGAKGDDDNGGASGSAYVFGVTTGNELQKLTASDGAASDSYGYSVALSGGTTVIGAYENDDDGTNSGSAYLFRASPGDISGNGIVNATDLGFLGLQWGTAGSLPYNADIAPFPGGDGIVDVIDLGMLGANWTASGDGSSSSATAVPVPAAGLAGGVILAAMWARTKRRR